MPAFSLVVVGVGPRAISLLEWLDRLTPSTSPLLTVIVIDPSPPGGRVWRTDQSECLLMNTLAEESTVFADASVVGADTGWNGPTLHEWALTVASQPGLSQWIREEAGRLAPTAYATRRLFGAYLGWAFQMLVERLHGRAELTYMQDLVVAIHRGAGVQTVSLRCGEQLRANVVCCLPGHTQVIPSPAQAALIGCAEEGRILYGPPSHPTEAPIEQIEPGEAVVLRGLALNFHDVVALLTEARGGRFTDCDGQLVYEPSGREPTLYAGSRRGIPQYARIDKVGWVPTFRVFTPEAIEKLLKRGPEVDARRDLYPLVTKEAILAYYARLSHLDHQHPVADWEGVVTELAQLSFGTKEWDEFLEQKVPAQLRLSSLLELADPLHGMTFEGIPDLNAWMMSHLKEDVACASRPDNNARVAIPVVLRALRWRLSKLFAVGGVSGASFQRDIDGWFGDLLRTLSNGPPVSRTRELTALCREGVLSFVGGGMSVECHPQGLRLMTASIPTLELTARGLVDCYVPRQDLSATSEPLLGNLLSSGRIRRASRPDSKDGQQATLIEAVDVVVDTGQVIDSAGFPDSTLLFGGIPIEGLRWNTALAGRTGVDSEFFQETRGLARAVLEEVAAWAAVAPAPYR